jgi:hypothetical protein
VNSRRVEIDMKHVYCLTQIKLYLLTNVLTTTRHTLVTESTANSQPGAQDATTAVGEAAVDSHTPARTKSAIGALDQL